MPLAKRTDYGDSRFAGVEVDFAKDVPKKLEEMCLCGFDFIVTPLTRPDYRPPQQIGLPNHELRPPLKRDDVLYLSSTEWVNQVVGSVSEWVDPDSPDPQLRRDSTVTLKAELAWAGHLGLQAVMLPTPKHRGRAHNYSQIIHQALEGLTQMALWISVPLTAPNALGEEGDPWEWWNTVRTLCDFHNLLGVVLQVGPELPSSQVLSRWIGEPLKALLLPTSVFYANKRGYPVLPKAHQELLAGFFNFQVQVILKGPPLISAPQGPSALEPAAPSRPGVIMDAMTGLALVNPGELHPLRSYWEYLAVMFRKLDAVSETDVAESSYRDHLQVPLQPLQDNLESQTYETFEKDVTKYVQYEEAIFRALLDLGREQAFPPLSQSIPSAAPAEAPTPLVVMVVGAGRGPLVRCCMRASGRAGVPVRVYALEKNPNAVVHIEEMMRIEGWEDEIVLVQADMRSWQAPEAADILVSELLGSFGDNELSPECLDGAQRFLGPNGISIPSSYTSYLAPVTSAKLYQDVRAYKDLEHCETPYVVKLHRITKLAPAQPIFTFQHPNRDACIDNSRDGVHTFKRPAEAGAALLHGFGGYFEAVLYKDVMLSTHPPTHTPNMSSWFPIFFPIRDPLYLPAGQDIVMHIARCVAPHKVWYEWSVSEPFPVPIHNVNGRSYYVGL